MTYRTYRKYALVSCRCCYHCGKTMDSQGPLWCDNHCRNAFLTTWPATWLTNDPSFAQP